MSTKRPPGAVQDGQSLKAFPPATHIYASSLAVVDASILSQLQSTLTSLSQRISPLLQRDIILSRIDDEEPYRVEMESDPSYAPIRRARLQSRLHVRFESNQVELRTYAQTQGGGGATKGSDLAAVKSLVIIPLDTAACESFRQGQQNGRGDHVGKAEKVNVPSSALPREIDAGSELWRQATTAMGWHPHHTIIRSGTSFIIQQDKSLLVQIYLFQFVQLKQEGKPAELSRISDTYVLQAVVLIALPTRAEQGSTDIAKLSERAHGESVRLQEAFRGLVDFSRDVD